MEPSEGMVRQSIGPDDSGQNPKVSVLMSVYNGEIHLGEAVESILNQTFTDFEFIIVDDGSTDSTWSILSEYAVRDKRIVLIQNKNNIGLAKSLNKGLELARGEYVARQDADDLSLPERLAAQIGYSQQQPHVGLLGTAYYIINSQGQELALHRQPESDTEIRWQMLFHNAFCHSSVMFRRKFINKESLFYKEGLPCSQDYELWSRMLQQTSAANLTIPLVEWRKSDGAISTTRREEQQRIATIISAQQIKHLLPHKPITLSEVAMLRESYYGFSQRPGKQHVQLCLLLVQILGAFKKQPEVDSVAWNRIFRSRIDHIVSCLIASRRWDASAAAILADMLRLDALGIVMHLTRRAINSIDRKVKAA